MHAPDEPSKPATIYDVARRAGVSHQTVSRFVKGFEGIRPETRRRVEEALRDLDYRPNLAARFLATNRSHRIGALVYEMLEVGPSMVLAGASRGARDAGYLLDIVSLDPSVEGSAEAALQMLNQRDLAAVLAFAPTDEVVAAIESASFAVPVFVERETDDLPDGGAGSLSRQGMRQIVDHLVSLGHRRLFYVTGPAGWIAARNREVAFKDALRAHGLEPVGMADGDWSARSGFEAGMALPSELGATAVVAANDQTALGVLRALASRGIRVPAEMSVTGFDDMPESAYFSPPLTTVRLDFDEIGRRTISRVLTGLGLDPSPTPDSGFAGMPPPTLLVRSSSAATPAG